MKEIVFATHNRHKAEELAQLTKGRYKILTLDDINCKEEIAETGNSFSENAFIKAKYIFDNYQLPCFADDSGLSIPALNGEPGIYSARYAGTGRSEDNIALVLQKMKEHINSSAFFTTVIALIGFEEKEIYFEGNIHGHLIDHTLGENGFGYDPIFVPDGYEQTFAQMTSTLKNQISHRSIAVQKLIKYLSDQ